MIKVNKNGNVIKITGHSGYDNAGKDLYVLAYQV